MMSFRAVHAGGGYQYLLRSVATNDAYDSTTEEGKLSAYYQAKGTPPGRWIGRGCAGLRSQSAAVGCVVEAEQMEALYGLGMHPDAHERVRRGEKINDVRLGGKFPIYTNGIPVLDDLRAAEAVAVEDTGRLLTDEERSELAATIGRPHYVAATGWEHAPDKDVIDWVNEQRAQVKQAVAGFDLTFSPAKSVSVMWAFADEKTAGLIAACHHEAVAEVLAWAEDHVVRTRRGAGGLAQVKTCGIVASEFTHFDTRAGDPDLHSHVLVSNKVQGRDGKWRTVDSRALFKHHQTLSARYDAVVQEILSRRLGWEFVPSVRQAGKEPVWEVAGVPQQLIDAFSQRRRVARPVYERLVGEYVHRHGHQPDRRTQMGLWQAAILETRDAKKPAESLGALRAQWRAQVGAMNNAAELFDGVSRVVSGRADSRGGRRDFFVGGAATEEVVDAYAREVLGRVIAKRSYFARHHITAAVGAYLKGFRFADAEHVRWAFDLLTQRIIERHVVDLTAMEPHQLPAALRADDGQAVDRHLGFAQYTTADVLRQEDHVLQAAAQPVAVFASSTGVDEALASFEFRRGFRLNEGQEALARHLVTTGTLVACGVGPAGTGKTTSMQIVANVWQAEGRQIFGLAPSAAAAGVLGEELGISAHTIDQLTHVWRGRNPTKPGRDVSALPWEIHAGDMLLVDEAGMVTTDNLAALTEIAEATGAVVRVVGDPHQLDAVGTGGLFATMCRHSDAVELTDVMRFSHGNDEEQADASIQLRAGDRAAIGFYCGRGWVRGGTREDMLVEAVSGYLADRARGRSSLVVASTNTDVSVMNEMIREQFISEGEVRIDREVELSRGDRAGVGDVVIARSNQRLENSQRPGSPGVRVVNGQLFRVVDVHDDGSLTVADVNTGAVVAVPREYAVEHMHLGYAATVYRSQGATVETTHAVVDGHTDRAGLYVALTRGKRENRVYAVTDGDLDEFAEDAHEHSAGNAVGLTAVDVIGNAIDRDAQQRSATDIRAEAQEYAGSRERLGKLYRYGVDEAVAGFIDRHLPGWWDMIPLPEDPHAMQEAQQKIRAAWRDVLNAGGDPRLVMATAVFNVGDTHDVGSVVAWRVRREADNAGYSGEDGGLCPPPPLTRGTDKELHAWLEETYDTLTHWPKETPQQQLASRTLGEEAQTGMALVNHCNEGRTSLQDAIAQQLRIKRHNPAARPAQQKHWLSHEDAQDEGGVEL